MGNEINEYLKYLASAIVGAGIIGWIIKQAISTWLKGNLEEFKSGLKEEVKSADRIRREIVAWANPIQDAAISLERRLANILEDEGYKALQPGYTTADWSITYDYFLSSTMFLFGQYFCWIQMLRLELNFELFRTQKEKVALFDKIDEVSKALGNYPPAYSGTGNDTQVFRLQQRGVGELLARRTEGKRACQTYSRFTAKISGAEYQAMFNAVFLLVDRVGPGEKRWKRLEATHTALKDLIANCGEVLKLADNAE
jgi:hypothetical protein